MPALPKEKIKELSALAKTAAKKAYAPYSKFSVGAAVLLQDGSIVTGCNVENASYGLTICAERVAISKAVSENSSVEVRAVAIYTPTKTPTAPCGACRQVIHEFGKDAVVISSCAGKEVLEKNLKELLPDAFVL